MEGHEPSYLGPCRTSLPTSSLLSIVPAIKVSNQKSNPSASAAPCDTKHENIAGHLLHINEYCGPPEIPLLFPSTSPLALRPFEFPPHAVLPSAEPRSGGRPDSLPQNPADSCADDPVQARQAPVLPSCMRPLHALPMKTTPSCPPTLLRLVTPHSQWRRAGAGQRCCRQIHELDMAMSKSASPR